jgi:hypothetical protein
MRSMSDSQYNLAEMTGALHYADCRGRHNNYHPLCPQSVRDTAHPYGTDYNLMIHECPSSENARV